MAVADLSGIRTFWDQLENPVMGREFRARMRGSRSYVITGVYTLVVMVFVLLVYWVLAGEAQSRAGLDAGGRLNRHAAEVGRGIWMWGCAAQALLLPLLVPAFTCGGITVERERDLLEMLLLTRQSSFQICLGKLGSGVGLGLTLVLSSVPALALSVILGGVSPGEIAACLCVLVSAVVGAGALGLAASAVAPKTTSATVGVYMIVGFGLIGIPALVRIQGVARSLSETSSDLGIMLMLFACVLTTFPPAFGLAVLTAGFRRRRRSQPPDRSWWIAAGGLWWAALLLFLYLPGIADLLLQGGAVLLLHPVAAILGVMSPDFAGMNPLFASLWAVCTFCYTGAAVWLFYISVLRVQRMRG